MIDFVDVFFSAQKSPFQLLCIFYRKVVNERMTDKQKRFAEEYLKDCNATQAAIRCGYSPKTAKQQGQRLLTNADLKNYIDEQLQKMQKKSIASAEEVLEYLTSVVRGESISTELVVEGIGDGCSEAKEMKKAPSEKDRLKAAELIGKRYGLFTEKTQIEGVVPIVISGGDDLLE